MKRILLPTDFSNNAWNALFTAVKVYANVECQFYLLHAYEPNALNLLGRKNEKRLGVIYNSLAEYSTQELRKILDYLHKNHNNPNHSFECISKSRVLEEAIQEIIPTKDIDIVVMGTQGATGAKEVFMGSNTVKVLKKIKNYPILVVPSEYNFQHMKTLIFPTNYTQTYKEHQLSALTELVKIWNTKIQILHVTAEFELNDIQNENREVLKNYFSTLDYSFYDAEFEEGISHSIENYLSENMVDLMAVIRYEHTSWEKIIREPVIKKLAFHTKIPVLMLPEHV